MTQSQQYVSPVPDLSGTYPPELPTPLELLDGFAEGCLAGYGNGLHQLIEYVLQHGNLPPGANYASFLYDALVTHTIQYVRQMSGQQQAYALTLVENALRNIGAWQYGAAEWRIIPAVDYYRQQLATNQKG